MRQNAAPAFRVGEVVTTSFSILFGNLLPFGILFAVVMGMFFVPLILFTGLLTYLDAPDDLVLIITALLFYSWFFAVPAAYARGVLHALEMGKLRIGICLTSGLAGFFSALPVTLVIAPAIGVGYLVFVVPGLILSVTWWVASTVAVIEGRSVFAALKRSAELTKGNGWRVFGVLVIWYLINSVCVVVASTIAALTGIVGEIVSLFLALPFMISFGSIFTAVIYYRLRHEKEGPAVEPIASVFN